MSNKTALYEEHQRLNGRLIDFGGWELPVQYTGVIDEHLACRNAVGLFDVSHMGEISVNGKSAEAFLSYTLTNNIRSMPVGRAQYNLMCNHLGGVIDDLVVYRRGKTDFLLVVNASNTDKDFNHIQNVAKTHSSSFTELSINNDSPKYTQIAIQGAKAVNIVKQVTNANLEVIKNYWFCEERVLNKIPAIIARTGYTGEDGFELYVPWETGPELWRALLDIGNSFGIKPCGLGARDTLRIEMKYPLYGHEISDNTSPIDAGLAWVVALDKDDFIGKSAILKTKQNGPARTLVGLTMIDRGIPRQGYAVFTDDGREKIGEITSGTMSPSLRQAIAIAYLN
ncbi:MAG: glycine cleavage system aminomethyltransferase GcvT, partial [Candidatus Poribacteria bacterium]